MTFWAKLNLRRKITCCLMVLVGAVSVFNVWALICALESNNEKEGGVHAQLLKERNAVIGRDLLGISSSGSYQKEQLIAIKEDCDACEELIETLQNHFPNEAVHLKELEQGFVKDALSVQKAAPDKTAAPAAVFSKGDAFEKIQLLLGRLHGAAQERAHKKLTLAVVLIVAAMIAPLITAFFLAGVLQNSLTEPVDRIREYTAKLMQGDISATLETREGGDEISCLTREFAALGTFLNEIALAAKRIADGDLTAILMPRSEKDVFMDAFNRMIENIAVVTVQFQESMSIMGTAATEILGAVNDSAASASQTAVAATETSTIVEEVRRTAHVCSEKAQQVSESAQTTAKTSAMGRKAMEDIIEGMSRIREQVDLIAESMLALGDKSQSISGIIGTVDDLAKQSHLLAVNAQIEASRAGEFGRGFRVVAQEVKKMAEQSKNATAKVRNLIQEIQLATHAATIATELGGKTVEDALAQSRQAGESIVALAGNVVQSAEAASQIAASTQEQLTGVDHVAWAMESINKSCSEHRTAINRVEVATHRLDEIGTKLKAIVKIFDASQDSSNG
jgi:methyl-accepting chemotaxis protein